MAALPIKFVPLTPDDASDILEEIQEAETTSFRLGLKLKVPYHVVKEIHSTYSKPRNCLFHILDAFLKNNNPRPTWRVIIDALRSPAVDLPQLANKVESVHFPEATSTCEPETALTASTQATTLFLKPTVNSPKKMADVQSSDPTSTHTMHVHETTLMAKASLCLEESPEPHKMTCRYVQAKIRQLERRFNGLKRACRACLEKCKITVKRVVDALTDLPADDVDQHKQFIECHLKILYQSSNHEELFGALSFNMNYLSPQLLDYIADEFNLEIENEMEAYKKDLELFRMKTPLTLFCRTQKRRVRLSTDLQETVANFDWPHDHNDVTLEVVEQFRQQYACHYKLREIAMMLAEARSC